VLQSSHAYAGGEECCSVVHVQGDEARVSKDGLRMLRVLPGGEGEQHVAVTYSEEMGVWQMEGKWARRMGEDGEDKMGELGEHVLSFAFL